MMRGECMSIHHIPDSSTNTIPVLSRMRKKERKAMTGEKISDRRCYDMKILLLLLLFWFFREENDEERVRLYSESYDTKYAKSFRHFTREALPRMDNYRNIMSIHAAYRPTLDELHDATLHGKVRDEKIFFFFLFFSRVFKRRGVCVCGCVGGGMG